MHNKPTEPTAAKLVTTESRKCWIYSNATLDEVVNKMHWIADEDISALVVFSDKEELAGILTEKDIIRSFKDKKWLVDGIKAKDIMTPVEKFHGGWATPSTKMSDMGLMLARKRIRHIPVLGDSKSTPRDLQACEKNPLPAKSMKFNGIIPVTTILSKTLQHYHDVDLWQEDLDDNMLSGGGAGAR